MSMTICINTAIHRGGSDRTEVRNGFNRFFLSGRETVKTVAEVVRPEWPRDASRC